MRPFDEGEPIRLTLISSETFKTGVLNLVYAPAESAGNADHEDAKVHLPQHEQWNPGRGVPSLLQRVVAGPGRRLVEACRGKRVVGHPDTADEITNIVDNGVFRPEDCAERRHDHELAHDRGRD
jgi:hypothetical protein